MYSKAFMYKISVNIACFATSDIRTYTMVMKMKKWGFLRQHSVKFWTILLRKIFQMKMMNEDQSHPDLCLKLHFCQN